MANVNAAFGFVPVRHMSSSPIRTNKYTITSGLAENIFSGDLVILTADGVITPSNGAGEAANTLGVFGGCSYTASDGSYVYSEYWPTGTTATDIVAYIYDDYNIIYKVMSDGSPAQTNIGNCAEVVATAGSTVTGRSKFQLNSTMAAGEATCKLIALYDAPENAFGANAVMEVLINEHLLKRTAGI